MSQLDPRTPVIVGAGQLTHRHEPGGEYRDPVSLAVDALRLAAEDSGAGEALLRRADSVRAVASTCASLPGQASLVATELGVSPRETVQTVIFGGDSPQLLLNDTAAGIAAGELDVALLSGAEAFATLRAAHSAGELPGWPDADSGEPPARTVGTDRVPVTDVESAAGLAAPVYVYALLETALRARDGLDREAHLERIAGMWARFSEVAAQNPHAWLPRAYGAEEIATPSDGNRVVSTPYTKLLTANIGVDQAAALIVTSAEAAEAAGVSRDRWVFPWAGAEAHERWFVSERAELAASPALAAAGRAALEHAGVAIDDVGLVDIYSCFPVAVEIAAAELGLPLDDPARPLTLTGGLTFAGGPGNDYVMHSIATLVTRLRDEPETVGLTSAVGWYMTKHAVGLYSGRPPEQPFRRVPLEPALPVARPVATEPAADATIESYTVGHDRSGNPEGAIVSALDPDGTRTITRVDEEETLAALLESDPLGETLNLPNRAST